MDSANRFSNEGYISLETYKKSGEAVRSPVWVVEDSGTVYVRTDPTSWKAKRIRRNQRVRLAPSDMRGKPTGSWVDGVAHFVEEDEAQRILKLFKKKYGLTARILDSYHRLRGSNSLAVISIKLA